MFLSWILLWSLDIWGYSCRLTQHGLSSSVPSNILYQAHHSSFKYVSHAFHHLSPKLVPAAPALSAQILCASPQSHFQCSLHNALLTFVVKACHSKSSPLTHCSSASLALSVMAPGTAPSFSLVDLSHTGFLPEPQLGQAHIFLKMFQEWLPQLEHSPSRHTASVLDPSLGL